jgi:sugar/nucleoside kinase (ribokinase family)
MFDICCVGHITKDRVVNSSGEHYLAGGTAFYFANALHQMPVKLGLVTAVGQDELTVVDQLNQQGVAVTALPSEHSVYFENIYAHNQDHRTQRVLQKAEPFGTEQFADVDARIFHLGPLLADDMPLALIQYLATKGKVSLDAQGYLREVRDYQVHAIDWPEKLQALPHISILKVNEFESEVLTGINDIRDGARQLAEWGVQEVVVTLGSAGSLIYVDGEFHEIPAYVPTSITDATGCGDTYMAGYLYQRNQGKDIVTSGKFAAAVASLKIAAPGPYTGTEGQVLQFLNEHEQ